MQIMAEENAQRAAIFWLAGGAATGGNCIKSQCYISRDATCRVRINPHIIRMLGTAGAAVRVPY